MGLKQYDTNSIDYHEALSALRLASAVYGSNSIAQLSSQGHQ